MKLEANGLKSKGMAGDWSSYDSAAAAHDRYATAAYFEQPARELVARMDIRPAARILDVGTGTGIAARCAAEAAGEQAMVVGIDLSFEMVRIARERGLRSIAVATAPGLAFADRTFDRVTASFVLSHVTSYQAALLDMARVLKPHGRVGLTAWGSLENEWRTLWRSLAERFVDKDELAEATRNALPWEEWFSEPDHLGAALRAAGLGNVEVTLLSHTVRMSIRDFLTVRDSSVQARFMRHVLPGKEWQRFRETAETEFHKRANEPLDQTRDFLVATGARP